MRIRIPLYGKVLFWFFVNLAIIAILAGVFMQMQFRLGLDSLLAGPERHRLEAMGEVIAGELRGQPLARWNDVLARYKAVHGATFTIFRNDGVQAAGEPLSPPPDVLVKVRDRRGLPGPASPPRIEDRLPPGDRHAGLDALARRLPPARIRFVVRSENPVRYWVGVHIGLIHPGPPGPQPVTLLITSDSITGSGLFFDPLPWLALGGAALVLSALVWLPVVGGITRSIRRVNIAARSIAEGRFDVRVPDRRRDELGELGSSVNAMAGQLGGFVERHRRLTADVAHELCSPVARMQRALGIVEQRATPEQAGYIKKLDDELQHMARLVEEVLSFSKAASPVALGAPEDIDLTELVSEIVSREAADSRVEIDIPNGFRLHTIREALDRAISNILRNAVRYAGHAGPIEIRARQRDAAVEILIRDHGPGIPADAMEKIFEPFYRPEAARQRATGGAGLGLAIVRRCVEACGGTVTASPADPSGLAVCISLPQILAH